MVEAEKQINFGNEEDNSTFKQDIDHSFQSDLSEFPEVLEYIQRLQDCITRQRRIILTLYEKHNTQSSSSTTTPKSLKYSDASTQTCEKQFLWEQSTAVSAGENGNIVDQVKEAAESAVLQSGFVYEATSGMYYDYNTGYYYDAELGLYYDGHSGTYYTYDEERKEFQFHSSVQPTSTEKLDYSVPNLPSTAKKKDTGETTEVILESTSEPVKDLESDKEKMELEEGECSDDSDVVMNEQNEESGEGLKRETDISVSKTDDLIAVSSPFKPLTSDTSHDAGGDLKDEIANSWPGIRIIVQETDLEKLSIGSLFIVTCIGGTLGREGNHAVIVPDIKISKHHAKFSFSEENKHYFIVDLGSRNGTFLNGNRLSVALQESEPHPIHHGDTLRVGSTCLLCHVHVGQETCQQCEPGCVPNNDCKEKVEVQDEGAKERHRMELRRLRRKFGLEGPGAGMRTSNNYRDRAEERRITVGSSDDNFKTETASVNEMIKSDNKGFKMLAKMGWSEGQPLGKDAGAPSSVTEPILVEQRRDKVGLGCSDADLPPQQDRKTSKKKNIWKKAQKRYEELS